MRNNKGFSLVELIVVIAIMAILASVAVVGVSFYIPKAQKAADDELLNVLTDALVAACLSEGVDPRDVVAEIKVNTDGSMERGQDGKVVIDLSPAKGKSLSATTEAKIADMFNQTFTDTATFYLVNGKVVYFDGAKFVWKDSQYSELFNTLKEKYGEDIANKILNSNLGAIGTEKLFDQMNSAMDLAGELNLQNLGGEAFANAYLSYLGINLDDYDSDEEAQAAIDAKLAALGVDDATAANNAIALYAAQNSSNLSIDSVSALLGRAESTDDLMNSNNADTLANSAAIYSLYLSYQQEINGSVPTDPTLDIMTDALTDSDFANWVSTNNNAEAELDAYKTYMGIINEASKDDNTRDEILVNGFQDPELEELMKELVGN